MAEHANRISSGARKEVAPGIQEDQVLGKSPETLPFIPGINWATRTYDAAGDIVSDDFGVRMIGIGPDVWQAFEGSLGHTMVHSIQTASIPPDFTRIQVGFLGGNGSRLTIVAEPSHPFALDDPNRINAAADTGKDLAKEVAAIEARNSVKDIVKDFTARIQALGEDISPEVLTAIALMSETLKRETLSEPRRLIDIGEKMAGAHLLGSTFGVPASSLADSGAGVLTIEKPQYDHEEILNMAEEARIKAVEEYGIPPEE
ncbi:MAG: hypothetical protein ACHQT7_01965 [Candidatus Levyibacteriota bacterium]